MTRNEFNSALALAACAQKNMGRVKGDQEGRDIKDLKLTPLSFLDISLLNVYQHRNGIPVTLSLVSSTIT